MWKPSLPVITTTVIIVLLVVIVAVIGTKLSKQGATNTQSVHLDLLFIRGDGSITKNKDINISNLVLHSDNNISIPIDNIVIDSKKSQVTKSLDFMLPSTISYIAAVKYNVNSNVQIQISIKPKTKTTKTSVVTLAPYTKYMNGSAFVYLK